jgi:fibronectin type 3 domain-containing protein
MFKYQPNSIVFRSFTVAVCLALLAGCGASSNDAASSSNPVAPGTTAEAPTAPTDLSAAPGNAQASLTWVASSGAASYDVKRSTTNGGPYTQLVSATSPSYIDAAVSNGTTYYYVVTASNPMGESADSAQASATPNSATTTPAVPTGLTAGAGNAQVSLKWSASGGATSYHVKRATTSGGPYTQVSAPTSTSYTNTALTNGTTYYFVVSALDSAGESANSTQVSALPVIPTSIPAVPAGLAAISGSALVTLNWSPSNGAASYHVKRATTSGGPYTQVGAPTSDTYSDTTVTNGAKYFYVVSALDAVGESANSAQVTASPVAPAAIPAIPAGLSAAPGNAQASLTWSASSGATSYHVKRAATSGGPYTQVGAPTSASYTDPSLVNGTTYFYVVSALDAAGESANSTQVSALPTAPVSNPPPTTFGTWINVTPSNADLTDALGCGNYGTESVQADTANPGHLYTEFMCQGIWKSTDYGATWTGPINTGTNGAAAGNCAGGITIAPSSTAGGVPTLFEACIRGNIGFWKSVDGGVSWTLYSIAPTPTRQDYYPPVVDPYNTNHLLTVGHEMDALVQSIDGGQTWTNVNLAGGMLENGGTGAIFFINTGNASTTAGTWLWMGQQSGGVYGTWRTTNAGASWARVDSNEHVHGIAQIYQPDGSGVIYISGAYSALGWGVLRSGDYGQTWTHVGGTSNENAVFGTSKNVYAMFGFPVGIGGTSDPAFEIAAQPGTGTWVTQSTPAGLAQGSSEISVVNDGTHNILVGAMWASGLWRYIEP